MKRLEIAQYIALGATCMTVLGFVINLATQSRWSITMCGSVSYTHLRAHRDGLLSRMPSSA